MGVWKGLAAGVFAAALMLWSICAYGQGFQGTVRGSVFDQSNAVIPGAEVRLTNIQTGETRTQITTDAGTFEFPHLLLSTYRVTVELAGFRTYVRDDVQVKANQVANVIVRLQVGELSETVAVVGGAEIVNTSSAQLEGLTVRDVSEVPSNTLRGDPNNLAILAPGTTTQSGGVVGIGGAIGGNRPRMNNFVVDGVDNNDPGVTGPLTPVIQDAVEEFTLLTNQFSAEYGHSTAGQFITTTRSGTNEFHGRAWWYNQNRHTNALDNLTRAITPPEADKPRYDWNRLGGQVGGPIIKDKWFFFSSYEYRNLSLAGRPSGAILVPTSAGLSTLQALAGNPATGVSPAVVGIISENVPVAAAASDSRSVLNEATGQQVPIELGVFGATTPQFDREKVWLLSSDFQTARHRFSGRFNLSRQSLVEAGALPVARFNSDASFNTERATFSDVFSLDARAINEFRIGWNRGLENLPVDLPAAPGPSDVFGNYGVDDLNLFIGPQSNFPQSGGANIYQFTDNFSVIRGAHTLKFGAEVRNIISTTAFLPRSRGEYVYESLDQFVRDRFPSVVSIRGAGKEDFADNRAAMYFYFHDSWKLHPRFSLEIGLRYEYTQVARDSALQDLNGISNVLSIRQEVYTPDLLAFLGQPSDSPLLGTRIFDSLPAIHQDALIAHVGESVIFRKPNADRNNFAPRLGLAWDVLGDGRTSLRAGFGVAHDVIYGNLPLLQMPPQVQAEVRETNTCLLSPAPAWCGLVAPGGSPLSADIRHSTTGFIEGGAILSTLPPDTLIDRITARSATLGYLPDETVPEVYSWSLSLQRQLAQDWMVEGRYVGTHAVHLPVQRWLSAGVPNPIRLPLFLQETDALNTDFAGAPTLGDIRASQNLLLFPYGFGGVLTQFTPDGQSWYHGASASVQKRFSETFSVMGNYTWSRTIDLIENDLFTSFMNPRRPLNHLDIFENKGLSGLHHEHKLAISWLYELPRSNSANSFVRALVNGWHVNGSYLAETGQPLTILSRRDVNGDFDTAGDRAFFNPNGRPNTGSDVNFLCWNGSQASISGSIDGCGGSGGVVGYVAQDPSAQYIRSGEGMASNLGRNTFLSPGINVWNLSFAKDFPLSGEESLIRFHVELWNAFNHANFTVGNGSIFNAGGVTTATGFPGYVTPGTGQFLDKTIFSGGLGQAPFQRVIQWGVKVIF